MKKPILINAIVVLSALQVIGSVPVSAQDTVYPNQRMDVGVFGNLVAERSEYDDYERREPRRRDERRRPDDRERHRRRPPRHHQRKRAVREKAVEVRVPRCDRRERVERVERVEDRRYNERN